VTYQAIYYRDSKGVEPVDKDIDALDPACQDSIDRMIGLLNRLDDSNPELPYPHSSAIKTPKFRAFRELRADCGPTHYRIIFRRSERFFILLHLLYKTNDIPEADLKIASARWDDFKARMDANPRRPPRAMGHDAP
jgi:phage-related protein